MNNSLLESFENFLNKYLHGSGWDCKWSVYQQKNGKYICTMSYHCMSESGMYDGYLDLIFTLEADMSDFNLIIKGSARQKRLYGWDKDYFISEFNTALETWFKKINKT